MLVYVTCFGVVFSDVRQHQNVLYYGMFQSFMVISESSAKGSLERGPACLHHAHMLASIYVLCLTQFYSDLLALTALTHLALTYLHCLD